MKVLNGFSEGGLVIVWARVDQARVACEVALDVWAQPKAEVLPCTLTTHELVVKKEVTFVQEGLMAVQ